jgi:hypothetical protein
MSILEQLKSNKGTISSALSKRLADDVLNGNTTILKDAIGLSSYCANNINVKNIRSGAAKIVECVAEKKPELVSPFLEQLLPALSVEEPQTRWMAIRTMGYCAGFQPEVACKALPFAKKYIREKVEGQLCLVSSADLFLGDYGSLSMETAQEAFPVLLDSIDNEIMNEQDWLLEALIHMAGNLDMKEKEKILSWIDEKGEPSRKTTQERIKKLKKVFGYQPAQVGS